ncbi:MAG: flagellar export protein FliJ [Candidatus Eremiobacteraeota bacterium]|nr:flagellar export protein FliJ [Candidatus Eremiobacteraeota bacterium]
MGARFRFTLQPLLDRRRRAEEEKRQDLEACRYALEGGSRELELLADSRRHCLERIVLSAQTGSTPQIRLLEALLGSVDTAAVRVCERRTEVEAAYERARNALTAASRERRVIEKLKERRRLAFQAEEARREELELDESNARCREHARRNRPPSDGVRKGGSVIALTRLNGQPVMLNCELIESVAQNGPSSLDEVYPERSRRARDDTACPERAKRVEELGTAETVVTLTTGNVVVVREPMDEIERKVIEYKRKIHAARTGT